MGRDARVSRSLDVDGADFYGWVAQLVLTLFGVMNTFLSQLYVDSCTETSCDYGAFAVSINASYIGALVLLVASAFGIVVLRRLKLRPEWAPIVGIVLLITWFVVTYALGRAALQLPLFGNRPA
ncbi:hypothetical protein SAMN04488591_2566 [Microbacterium azadirachtae]|uniref:Uncharacterized protein n=1 Tax=Microbacterium azadirachtae TaxID=582680 RepID=A0A1I6I887_9MICO|nr:hypothetical protein [Microbacterium azadirachtae]SFR62936.1 hypothetical protein SAMN04488591_2566 [Microbacterium azadirachtae]